MYGSYTTMDLNFNQIVDIALVQSSEVTSSVSMEKGLIRSTCTAIITSVDWLV
uniref:Uncharacterized protein n=1 Tax=Amphimedon queenslandica TaxID=400682 RepID=A0A1X7V6T6_AMPQE